MHKIVMVLIALVMMSMVGVSVVSGSGVFGYFTDPDRDGLYEDVNGNRYLDFADIVMLYDNLELIQSLGPNMVALFDFNGNGSMDFDDCIELYNLTY